MSPLPDPTTVVIASPLEAELVERIRAVDPDRLRVIHEPTLIPRARFAADHTGIAPDLDDAGVERWLGVLRTADILFDFDWYAPADLPTNAPRLRWVQLTRSGVGEYLRRYELDGTPITFTNCAGVHAVPLAEFVALGLLYLVKEVADLRAAQARRSWEQRTVRLLAGRRVLLMGLGGLGLTIARYLTGLDMEVWGLRRSDTPAPEHVTRLVPAADLHAALGAVDALVIACPYTAETHHLIGRDEVAALRPGAFVINVARGAIIDEAALVEALRGGHLGGAALDVFETEPLPADSPLWTMPNVLVSPHRASIVEEENGLIVDLFVDNLRRFLDGRPLRNVYEHDRGY